MTDRMWVELLSVAVRPGGDPGEETVRSKR